jgi:hypothetical protein
MTDFPPPSLDEQADNALHANERNFYKVEKWSR